jgi:hypothetical protein
VLVRGSATLRVEGDDGIFAARQHYGQSYQLFEVPLSAVASRASRQVKLRVRPENDGETVFILAGSV